MAERAPFIASCVGDNVAGDRLGAGAVVEHHQDLPRGLRAGAGRGRPARSRPPDARPPLHAAAASAAHQRTEPATPSIPTTIPRSTAHDDPWSDERLLAHVEEAAPLFRAGAGLVLFQHRLFPGAPADRADHRQRHRAGAEDAGARPARHRDVVHRAHARRSANEAPGATRTTSIRAGWRTAC